MKKYVLTLVVLSGLVFGTTYNTIVIDGTIDFTADETLAGTNSSTWYVTWDADNIFLGANNSDVNSGSSSKWVLAYIDTDPQSTPLSGNGTSIGITYNTQQPSLPFNADYHFRWKADNSYTNLQSYSGSAWGDGTQTNIAVFQTGTFIEIKIPRSNIGSPSQIYLVAGMINEAGGSEFTFFMLPSSNTEGYDANYSNYLGYTLSAGVSPNSGNYLDNSLPVSLSKFSGQSKNGFVQLNWSTDSEIENLGFNIYRSLADNPLELLASFTNTKSLEGYGSTNNYHEYSYNDNRVIAGETYRYVLADVDYNGVEKRHEDRAIALTYTPNADEIKPVKFALSSAYPNPFNPSTTIQYSVPEAGEVAFTIYDLSGRELWSANEITTSAGSHQLNWSGMNTNGQLLPSGLYIVQMRAGNFQATQKLSLVR